MQWYYAKAGVEHGPVPENELRAKLASGDIGAADPVWNEGMTDWIPVSQVEALNPQAGTAAPPPGDVIGRSPPSPYAMPATGPPGALGAPIPNYLWQSIVLILLCWPVGIPAVVYASKVDGMVARGDLRGALAASTSAKTWCWVGYGGYLALIFVSVMFFVVMIMIGVAV